MTPRDELILVDGSAFLFRAYHAMPELTNSKGMPTGAVYGVVNMLKRLISECQPKHIAVVFDSKGKTFRHDMYSEYKANRSAMPDDLREQISFVHDIVRAMGLPLICVPGVEADDVIGTLSVQASAVGMDTMIVSSDKDLTQLINPQVVMVDTMKDVRYDDKAVEAKFGVSPAQIIDYLALVGDTSDNIPGVPKVGPKTAAKWLAQYQTIDNLLEHQDDIKGKVGEYLRDNLDQLHLSRQLTTIKCDVELDCTPDSLSPVDADVDELRDLYGEMEFRTWLGELDNVASAQPITEVERDYQTILEQDHFNEWLAKLQDAELIAVDTETTSLDVQRAQLVGLSFAITPDQAAYLPLTHDYPGAPKQLDRDQCLSQLKPVLENPNIAKTGQNLKYDLQVLANHGIQLAGISDDTMLASYVLNAGQSRHDMDTLADKHLQRSTIKFKDIAGSGKKQLTFNEIAIEEAAPYAAEDAEITWQLHHKLVPLVDADAGLQRVYRDIEVPLLSVLAHVENNGVRIDSAMLKNQSKEIDQRLRALEVSAHDEAGEAFNIASPKQIQHILYDKLSIPVIRKTPKGQPSTAENVLQELAKEHRLPELILEHRALAKLKSTYTDKLPALINPQTGRIHTSYHQAVAATGRLSSSDPNLQNIPIRSEEGRKIREAFIPDDDHRLICADYSQIELRIMAHLSADPGLLNAFQNNIDVHRATAGEVFAKAANEVSDDERRRAKAINFGLIYGMSAFGLANQLDIEQSLAREYMEIYFNRYPGVKDYMETTRERARDQGYVETLYGRRLYLPDIKSSNHNLRAYAERTAINAPMQGTAADLIKKAMLTTHQWLTSQCPEVRMIMQVHDELVLEAPAHMADEAAVKVAELMASVAELSIPLVADTGIGENWKQAH